jgi:hypothetical protein
VTAGNRDLMPKPETRGQEPNAVRVPSEESQRLLDPAAEVVLCRFDEIRARIRQHTASFSEEEVADDVAAARAELPG